MKIVVMNYANLRIDVLNVPDNMINNDDVEKFLETHDYQLENISWMSGPIDFVPVQIHDYEFNNLDGEEIETVRDIEIK